MSDHSKYYSREDCIDALQLAAAHYGPRLSTREYRESGIKPSDQTIRDRFGSWNEAKIAAGLVIADPPTISQRECPFCGDSFGNGSKYIDHLESHAGQQ